MLKQNSMVDVLNINKTIDFTLLDPRATALDIERLCDIAFKKEYYSVCVNPCNVLTAKSYICSNFEGKIKVVAVVGFPLGANSTETKIFEARQAIDDGADEIDFVINIGMARAHDYKFVYEEMNKLRKACKRKVLKAILETCYFDENEIIKLCNICAKAKIDFVKTSTGFGVGGADEKTVSLMVKALQGKCKVKASGGIRTREQVVRLLNIGADRIGTSSII